MKKQALLEGKGSEQWQLDFGDKETEILMQLEGECKIESIIFLKINYLKAICLTLILTLSVVGLLLLKYFQRLRAQVFYTILDAKDSTKSTHVYLKSIEGVQQISSIQILPYQNRLRYSFLFRKLKYEIYRARWIPFAFDFIHKIRYLRTSPFIEMGLKSEEVLERERFYGKNEHKVQVPGYFQFLFDTMTQPLFLFQYGISLLYVLQNVALFGILMVVFSFVTTSVNYILLRRSYNKIKETAQKTFKVNVLRNGTFSQINNSDMVVGDIYQPRDQIPCDSLIVKGQLFVDQSNLTGENVPIAKFGLIDDQKLMDKSNWVFQGSKLETMKEQTLAVAINIGYSSQRGKIIRKILTKIVKQPEFFFKLISFQVQVLIISFLIYLVALPQLLSLDIDFIMVFFRFLDFITYCFPGPFPIFFNLAYSFCLARLNKANIIGTQSEKTVQSARMTTICFDKTGTLTLNKMQVSNIFSIPNSHNIQQITANITSSKKISDIFACCNSVQVINGQVKGDEIDLQMFNWVSGQILLQKKKNVIRQIKVDKRVLQVLKINQYQSKFQSMSVLVRSVQDDLYYVFLKGSPQMIHFYSDQKINNYDNFVKNLSFSGYRSIAFGYKEIRESQVSRYMSQDRESFLKNSTICGVVTFINQLKQDAKTTISTLAMAEINTKIITGDNIFLGIQTAMSIGMIPVGSKIIVLQGKKYNKLKNSIQVIQLTRVQNKIEETQYLIEDFSYDRHFDKLYAIDNDFIKENSQFLHEKVKVFARISPENKALIVNKHKQQIKSKKQGQSKMQKLLGDCNEKVGMVGDGANDLIAIKQADVGIGISSSDAVYSASFAIQDLKQILQIINESKNAQRQIVQMAKYYSITQFSSLVVTIIMTSDSTHFTGLQLIYKNLFSTLLITVFFGLTKPAKQLTKSLNNTNMLDLQNHVQFWSITILYSLGQFISYLYYSGSDDFVANTNTRVQFPEGWYGETKCSTINFIAINVFYLLLPFALYQSDPWKQKLWKNLALTAILVINMIIVIVFSFATPQFLGMEPIALKEVLIVLGIMLITLFIIIFVNKGISKYFFNRRNKNRFDESFEGQQLRANN